MNIWQFADKHMVWTTFALYAFMFLVYTATEYLCKRR